MPGPSELEIYSSYLRTMIRWQIKRFEDLSPEELYSILRLREEVFVVEQNCPFIDADGYDIQSYHLTGKVAEDLVAYARIVFRGAIYEEVSIGRIVTSAKYRGKGFGKLLMTKSLEESEHIYGKVRIRIQAQEYLQKFYERYGFVKQAEPFLLDGISHIIMLRDAG